MNTYDREYVERALRRAAKRLESAVGMATGERPGFYNPTDRRLTFDENLECMASEAAWHMEQIGTPARLANRVLREMAAFGAGLATGLDVRAVQRDTVMTLGRRIVRLERMGPKRRASVKRTRRQISLAAEIITPEAWADYIGDNLTATLIGGRKGAYRVPDDER